MKLKDRICIDNITQSENIYKIGDVIKFGENEGKSIEWIVLKVHEHGGAVLLLSKNILDAKPYNFELKKATWEKCSLRNYLNNEFIDNYFNETEKRRIEKMNGNDRVFCLSIEYFKRNYFVLRLDKSINSVGASWWLRSKGENSDYRAMYVDSTGRVDKLGDFVNLNNGVRPALWLGID